MPVEDTKRRLKRLVSILRLLGENDRVNVSKLAKDFLVSTRTINRDLRFLREAGFTIVRVDQGVYSAAPSQLDGLEMLDEDELSFLIATRHLVRQLLPDIEPKLTGFLGLTEDLISPVHISAGIPQMLSNETQKTMRVLLSHIAAKREITFLYKEEDKPRRVEPYKLAYLRGFWYLLARDMGDSKIKSYAIDRIKDISTTKRRFACVPENELQDVYYPYLGHGVGKKVEVLVKKEVAHYFKRKKFDPTQSIEEETKSGDLIVSFLAVSLDPIKNFVIKPWLPNIFVLKPEDLRKEVMDEMQEWMNKQNCIC